MFRKKKIINFLLLVLVFSLITFNSRYSFAKSLTNDELLSVKNNGIVSAMCYVNNLLTGPVAKAIMAVSVLGIGWLFLLGGASWITVLMFTIASSLVFGGIELANLISGNTYSCKTFQEAQEKYDDLIYNKGVCSIHEITGIYSSGQVWKKCFGATAINSSNVDSLCREDITNNTEINEPDKIILYGCQEGYLKKNRDNYLSYTCKLDNNEVGYFSPKEKGESGDTNNYDMATCLKACKLTDLKNTYKNFNLRSANTDNDGNTKIISNSGYTGYLEGGYYSQGTKLDVTCKEGFIISMRDENGVCSSDADLGFICGENAIFTLKKACQIACDLKKVNSKLYVAKWHEKSVETCRPNGLSKDMYISGDILDAQTCEDGYDFEYKKDGTAIIIECSSSGDWMNNGNTCHKTCLKQDLLNKIPGNRLIGCSDADDENCDVNINNRDKFQYQEVVSVTDSCESGFSMDKTSGEKLARYICGYNGIWENTNYGSLLCERNCNITAEDNRLTGRDNTQSWLIYNSTSEKFEDLKINILTNGQRIKPKTCKEGSNVYSDGAAEFICDNGRFNFAYAGDVNEYCKPGCKFKELKNLTYKNVEYDTTSSSKSWIICTENGIKNTEGGALFGSLTEVDLLTGTDREKFARVGTFYKIKECNSGYKISSQRSNALVVKCDNSGSWIISNEHGWNFCRLSPYCYEMDKSSSGTTTSLKIISSSLEDTLVKLQLWGAPGGGVTEEDNSKSNLGGYSYGEISVKGGDLLYINVGEKGKLSSKTSSSYNGGGYSAYVTGVTSSSGGGATDIRYGGTGLDNRVLVAGGGGGSISINGTNHYGHKGGGLFENTTQTNNAEGIDGSSVFTEGSKLINKLYNSFITTGVKGAGGNSLVYYLNNTTPVISSGGGGGGGYYGGSGGANAGGGGGSGFIDSKIIQNGITTITNEGPTDGGFARVCWGDWYGLKNPCESNHEDKLSYQKNSGIGAFIDIDETVTCVAPEVANNPIRDKELSGIGRCSRESLKEILTAKHAKLPEAITDDMLPNYYYEGMTIRNQCESGYDITDGDDQNRIEFTCSKDNSWTVKGGCSLKPGCYEFTSSGTGKKLDFSTIHNDISEVQLQAWGAPGGTTINKPNITYGGYSKGTLRLTNNNKVIYVVVGGKGGSTTTKGLSSARGLGGFNGGGDGGSNQCKNCSSFAPGAGGGGATDIRYGGLALTNRVIVAGGAGGNSGHTNNTISGKGGGTSGGNGNNSTYGATGGTQNNGGANGTVNEYNDLATSGVLGQGGHGTGYVPNTDHTYYGWQYGAGGGGGYYGGGGSLTEGSGGGSGYIGGVVDGSTTTVSSGPTDGGFVRICWGDWKGQTNPCSVTNHNSNAGITTNSTKCTLNPSFPEAVPGTLNTCSRDSMLTAFTNANVKQPNNAAANLPDKYYEGMKVRGDCNSGYKIDGGNNGKVEFSCQSNGTWAKNGECKIFHGCYEFTSSGTGKKLDFSTIHNDISEVQLQAWGAPGGTTINKPNITYGGYSKGTLRLTNNNKVIYVVVGGKGTDNTASDSGGGSIAGGFNGGGNGASERSSCNTDWCGGGGGGGATDIRYGGLALTNRVMVAGGAGGSILANGRYKIGGNGGGNEGVEGDEARVNSRGTQTAGGEGGGYVMTNGVLGQGGFGNQHWSVDNNLHRGAGGGGGYYGGSSSINAGGSGGSGYIGGVVDGSTTTVSSGPTDGGFVRICWGDWTGQTNPCSVTNHNSNAGITTNSTKCTLNPSLTNATPGTLNTCSRTSLLTAFTNANVTQPNNAAANLPDKYYEGMKVRGDCNSSYIVVGGNNGKVEFTCQSNGTWSKSGECIKGCVGKPTLITGSQFIMSGNNISSSGNFYLNGVATTPNTTSNFTAAHGAILDANCNTSNGYTEVKNGGTCNNCGGKSSSWSHYYYCDNGTWKYSGNCIKACLGKPSLITGSKLHDDGRYGTFYVDGTEVRSPSISQINSSSFAATNGAIIDAGCEDGYIEPETGGTCDSCGQGSVPSYWGHYYYCDNGTWKYRGSCINTITVRYVSRTDSSKYKEKSFTLGTTITCVSTTFGGDPHPNVKKKCVIANRTVGCEDGNAGDSFSVGLNLPSKTCN